MQIRHTLAHVLDSSLNLRQAPGSMAVFRVDVLVDDLQSVFDWIHEHVPKGIRRSRSRFNRNSYSRESQKGLKRYCLIPAT